MNKSYRIELENNLSHIKITTTAENKRQRLREERCKYNDNTRCVIEEETEALGVKPLRHPPSDKQSTRKCSWDT